MSEEKKVEEGWSQALARRQTEKRLRYRGKHAMIFGRVLKRRPRSDLGANYTAALTHSRRDRAQIACNAGTMTEGAPIVSQRGRQSTVFVRPLRLLTPFRFSAASFELSAPSLAAPAAIGSNNRASKGSSLYFAIRGCESLELQRSRTRTHHCSVDSWRSCPR